MTWIETLGLVGVAATLIGVFLALGPWQQYRRKLKRDDATILNDFARTITTDYRDANRGAYHYGEVKDAIPLMCVVNNDPRSKDLLSELDKPRQSRATDARPTLVIGEYGQGKTIACGALAHRLATSFLADPKNARLPILVSLRDHPDVSSPDQVALASIRRLHNVDLDRDVYNRTRAAGGFVYIFDGLDELLSRADSGTVREYLDSLRTDAAFRENPLIITSRPNVFDLVDVSYLKDKFDWITIQLPTLKQVYGYLSSRGLVGPLKVLQSAGADLIQGLIRRPLFLDMLSASSTTLAGLASSQDITESRIYDQYFNAWYLRERPKLGPSLRTLSLDQTDRILSAAASLMTSRKTTFLDDNDLVGIVQAEAASDPRKDLDTLTKQATNRLLLVPEFTVTGRRFTFRHDSLRSYFTARSLYKRFIRDPAAFSELAEFDAVSILFFLAIIKSEATAQLVLSGFHDADVKGGIYRADLLGALILHWAIDNRRVVPAYLRHFCAKAPDAVRALLLGNLSNKDLSSVDLTDVNLSHAIIRNSRLDGATMIRVDLSGSTLDGSKVTKAIISNTQLVNVSMKLADLTESRITNAAMSGSDFERASFKKVDLRDCSVSKVRFTGADFTEGHFSQCVFDDSTLVSATFDNSTAVGCRWRHCDLNGTSFRGARLTACEFNDSNVTDAVGLPHEGWSDGRVNLG